MLREQVLCPFQIQTNQCVSFCWRTRELIESVNVGYGSCCLQELRVVLGPVTSILFLQDAKIHAWVSMLFTTVS